MSDLSNIKVGDCVTELRRGAPVLIAKVTRVTATLIVAGPDKWRRKDGYIQGDRGWDRLHIEPTTAEHREKMLRTNRLSDLRYADRDVWEKLTDEQLAQVCEWIGAK